MRVRRTLFEVAATAHTQPGLKYNFSGHYEGEHWLGTFTVYLLSRAAIDAGR